MDITPQITWVSERQREVYRAVCRFLVLRAGRRWGKTKGAFNRMAEICFSEPSKHLWVDTTQGNIGKYFDEHMRPILAGIPEKLSREEGGHKIWHWDKVNKILKWYPGGKDGLPFSQVDFGSAERPENLEGFGYTHLWCNEAGIIFKGVAGERLWSNTLRPMAMEHRAKCYFIGTPKGPGLFANFIERGLSEATEWADWAHFHFTSQDRPGIAQDEIDKLIAEYPGGERSRAYRQEILAEIVPGEEGEAAIPYETVHGAWERHLDADASFKRIWGVDPSGQGADEAAIAKRQGQRLLEPIKTSHERFETGEEGARWVMSELDDTHPDELPDIIVIDSSAIGSGWYSHLKPLLPGGIRLLPVNWGKGSTKKDRFQRLRDELWWKAREWLETGDISADDLLLNELVKPLVDMAWAERKIYKVESKVKMLARYVADGNRKEGQSPNRADAFILTFAAGSERKQARDGDYKKKKRHSGSALDWLAA